MTIPEHLSYSSDHEWVLFENDIATVGVTSFATSSLGDIVFVVVPGIGERVAAGEPCGELESTKSVSDLVAPVSGEVIDANDIGADPGVINTDPYGAGWLYKVRVDGPTELLDAEQYARLCGQQPT